MVTFVYNGKRLRLFDHHTGWDPRVVADPMEGAIPVVADQPFRVTADMNVDPETVPLHFVMHDESFQDGLTKEKVHEALVLQCSTEPWVGGEHSIERNGKKWVILRMKDRTAFENVPTWLPEFLELTREVAEAIAIAGNAEARHTIGDLEARYGHVLDVVCPWPMKEILPALAILCRGCLAAWAGGPGKNIEDALEKMGLKQDPSAANGLRGKWTELSEPGWWMDCFGTPIEVAVQKELKKKPLNQKPELQQLVRWIDGGATITSDEFAETVAGAYLQIYEELKPHG